jgi:3'-5' exonuclease
MALVFDIETVGEDWDALDEASQGALTRWIKRDSKTEDEFRVALEDVRLGLGLSPLTGSIVAIGALDTETGKGAVYFSAPDAQCEPEEVRGVKLIPLEEKEMLAHFWAGASKHAEFVSYNGRPFDVPFLAIRSAVHGVRPTKNLLANRYLGSQPYDAKHIDLLDQLTFYGAWNKRPSLHLFCRAFGIESPKAGGTTGDDVATLYMERKYLDIARYNAGDLFATAALYERWKATLA